MSRNNNEHFICDGYDRARSANVNAIRTEVEAEFRERLEAEGWFSRILLRREMRREVKARLERKAPKNGLYFANR